MREEEEGEVESGTEVGVGFSGLSSVWRDSGRVRLKLEGDRVGCCVELEEEVGVGFTIDWD